MAETLPAPRDLLTSLISSLITIPISDNTTTTAGTLQSHNSSNPHASADSPSNPLRLIPRAYRPILTTLHVLYPTALLPALDILDRRLVTRVILKREASQPPSPVRANAAQSAEEKSTTKASNEKATSGNTNQHSEREYKNDKTSPLYHLVSSAQPQSHRHHHTATSTGQVYIVRLESWNCTCAAFAFSAFPPLPLLDEYEILPGTASPENAGPKGENAWEFGGLSEDGRDGVGGVPCCKHLLACVLAEKWHAMLGRYVEDRVVGREEGAGMVGDL
ncbi:hypothetical protein F4861DRAFT_522518 [Xylaria intraflava]|nr:hypothetical protein F4861DRAFT_522518 [Xylaria intraflava]